MGEDGFVRVVKEAVWQIRIGRHRRASSRQRKERRGCYGLMWQGAVGGGMFWKGKVTIKTKGVSTPLFVATFSLLLLTFVATM